MASQQSDIDGIDCRKEIDRLFDLEYGRHLDALFRFGIIFTVGVVLHYYIDTTLTLWWMAAQVLGHAVHFLFLRTRGETCSRREVMIAGAMFWYLVAAFIWLPAELITSADPALRVGGAAGIGAMLVFLIYRSDRVLTIMLGEIFVIGCAIAWVVFRTIQQVNHPGAIIGTMLAAVGLHVYFTLTMLAHRRVRIEAERAALRSVQAQKMEAIGQLAGGVAHDFNNILTAVIGNLDLYDAMDTDAERLNAVTEAKTAALRAAELVKQLLAYARRTPMQIARRDVSTLLEQLQLLTRRLLPASITQDFEAPNTPLWVALDENQFITALVNLVVNARDAMPNGGTLTVSARPVHLFTDDAQPDGTVLNAGDYAEVTVADTGTGIPPEIIRRVTEPFFTTKAVGQGSGLGLSMVDGFARQSGGLLTIDSSPEGTAMHLLLPIAPTEEIWNDTAQDAQPSEMPPSQTQNRPQSGASRTVPGLRTSQA
ncbi:signal transduction histidine kinase [Rhodobacter viridis]|uniref:histidine kinase n=1 Tax=Rhodobacter viridis TaxID=1054202 RepID=A0A318U317_9RHOB|nr:ATP-binding protein [Rhodobacter viridis]PYF10705.1 signal transduction histidine kinase [Rhodobacter viridis]